MFGIRVVSWLGTQANPFSSMLLSVTLERSFEGDGIIEGVVYTEQSCHYGNLSIRIDKIRESSMRKESIFNRNRQCAMSILAGTEDSAFRT